jgi:hypothetical protein
MSGAKVGPNLKRRKPKRRDLKRKRGFMSNEKHFANQRAARKRGITKALRDLAADHGNLAKQAAALEAITDLIAPIQRALWGQPAIRGDQ